VGVDAAQSRDRSTAHGAGSEIHPEEQDEEPDEEGFAQAEDRAHEHDQEAGEASCASRDSKDDRTAEARARARAISNRAVSGGRSANSLGRVLPGDG
jgi:hypothetical protein